jgi:diaminopimelate decarboxylase
MASTGQQQQQPASLKQQQAERRRTTFPSVLSILQANALKLQVASMMEEEEEEQETEEQQEEREQQQKVLSILPSDFDFISTVNHMSESRSRAFLLLDFSAIVQTHTVWRKRLPKMKKNVQMVYSTRYNANIKLLQLFARLGVGLRVSTKYDLQRVKESCSYNDENDGSISSSVLWDDFSLLAKPTSFYRSLILDTHTRSDTTDETIPFAVDGIDEFDRIRAHLTSIANRRKQRLPCLNVVLKLDGIHHQDWKNVLTALSDQSSEFGHKVVGFAMELIDENKHGDSEAISSALEKLSDLIEFCHTSGILSLPQVHLTNPSTSSDIDISVIQWMENHAKLCRQITIDVSRLLVAHSAALCARIIGVKQNDASRIHYYIDDGCYGSLSNYSNKGIPLPLKSKKALGSSNISIEKDQQGILATVWGPTCKLLCCCSTYSTHDLYVSYGCVGLAIFILMLLLFAGDGLDKVSGLHRSSPHSKETVSVSRLLLFLPFFLLYPWYNKVCSDIVLPRLHRDDWLVFTDLGFCHEGTCFNGFSPPDIACCVIGGYL